ncbi:MAG: arginine repressor [Clostridia bacterium]|nr:arginine repressor [Clostridia bacterium]
MKNKRQELILEIIENNDIEIQDQLVYALKERGFEVTQATISRDIKELRLIKTLSDKGVYRYSQAEVNTGGNQNALIRIFFDTVKDIQATGHIIVVKTSAGMANAAAEAIDSLNWTEICGTIAGENTIFIAVAEHANVQEIVRRLKRMMK